MRGIVLGAVTGFVIMGVAFLRMWISDRFGPRSKIDELFDPKFSDLFEERFQ